MRQILSIEKRRNFVEIELKLELSPDAVELIAASGLLPRESMVAKQRSIYFDTLGLALQKAGLTLRIRRSKGKRIQTVKASGSSAVGLFARAEWERSVKDDVPVVDDTTPIRALLGSAGDTLTPLFEVHVERRTWVVREGDSIIEVVADRGHVVGKDRQSPVCEMELELKQGDPSALFTLACKIDALAPIRLGVLTKSERGYQLARPILTAFKAEPLTLHREVTAAEAFQQIVQACSRQFRLNEALLLEGRNIEALHQARVALRRLRSAFSIFKPLLAQDRQEPLWESLRWLTSEFGNARNLDVLLERSQPGPLHDRLSRAREGAYGKVEAALASARVRTLMLDLAQWITTGPWLYDPDSKKLRQETAREFAGRTLNRLRKRVKKDGRGLAKANDDVRHVLRKDAKKLRYAAEFFVALFDGKRQKRRYKRFIVALEELQDQLGLLNDLATAPDVLHALGIADSPEATVLLAKGNKKALLKSAADAHDELVDSKRYWR